MKFIILLSIILATSFFTACSDGESDDSTETESVIEGNMESTYYGSWIRVDNREYTDIISTTVIDDYEIKNENLIKVNTSESEAYYLMRASLSDIKVSGTIVEDISASLSPSRTGTVSIANVNVILENVLDPNIKEEVQTDEDGNFIVNSLPSGTYRIIVSDDENLLNTTITIENQVEDIGSYRLTGDDVHNFKAELILDDIFVYADENIYSAKVRIHNISSQIGFGLNFTIDSNDTYLKSFSNDIVTGSIEPDTYKDIPIYFSFNQMSENSKTVDVDVKIQDVNYNEWFDTFSFEIYKGYFSVNISTKDDSVKGYIIMPDTHNIVPVDIDKYGTIKLPLLSEELYHMLLSNPSIENETAYSIGINKAAQSFETFQDTPAHEPNNQESTAKTIELNNDIVSYLHATDMDYWIISTPESEYLFDHNLGSFTTISNVSLSANVTSNTITISEKLTNNQTVEASIDIGNIILNGVDTNTQTADVNTNDTIAIKLQVAGEDSQSISSTLLLGQNSAIFTAKTIDTTPPVFISALSYSVEENQLYAFNAKATDANEVSYSIVDFNSSFNINSSTGEVTFKTNPDYETGLTYSVTIQVKDASNNAVTQIVSIKILDVDVEFHRDSQGIVTDDSTGLMWQDEYDGDIKRGSLDIVTQYCEQITLGGYLNWRLPTLEELRSIVDFEKIDPAIFDVFENTAPEVYWTSNGYYVYFVTGSYDYLTSYQTTLYLRCVRSSE